MPRITRAALKAQAQDQGQDDLESHQFIHEDSDADPEVPPLHHSETSLDTSQDLSADGRAALADITLGNQSTSDDVFTDDNIAPVKKAKSKRKGKQQKEKISPVAQSQEIAEANVAPTLEETQQLPQSNISSFTTESDITNDQVLPTDSDLERSYTEPIDTPTQAALSLQEATPLKPQPVSSAPKTPKFNPAVHAPEPSSTTSAIDTVEDSFIAKIKTRSPSKMQSYSDGSKSPESYIEQTTSRAPRIEDSVEAIDALEDAIERISQGLPSLDGIKINSPVKSAKKTPARMNLEPPTRAPNTLRKSERTPAKSHAPPTTRATPRPRPTSLVLPPTRTTSKAPTTFAVTKQQKKPIIDGSRPKEVVVSQPPALSFSNSPAKALPNMTKKRVPSTSLSTSKPGFVPAKSSKAPTKPTFSLPGEVISAKLKAQREERLKQEAEAEKAKKNFKARPMPAKVSEPSVKPRENKSSQARLSIYAGGVNKENIEPSKALVRKPRPVSMIEKPKTDATRANSGVRRTTSVTAKSTTSTVRVSSVQLSAGQKSNVSKDEVVQQRAKGKEVFGRNKAEIERMENERKEKEEAARKARADAAERGRQASREWAEKQKRKLALQNAAKLNAGQPSRGTSTTVAATS